MSTPDAKEKVERALQLIEQAQVLMFQACQELSPIIGALRHWEHTSTMAYKVKAHWYKVEELRHRANLRLDSEPLPPDILANAEQPPHPGSGKLLSLKKVKKP